MGLTSRVRQSWKIWFILWQNRKKWVPFFGGGGLEYESDGYVPTGGRKQGAFSVGFHRKKGVIGCGIKKMGLFWCELPKIGGHLV